MTLPSEQASKGPSEKKESPMTDEQADTEATRRWGEDAVISKAGPSCFVGRWFPYGAISQKAGQKYVRYFGVGTSWESAFASADVKEAKVLGRKQRKPNLVEQTRKASFLADPIVGEE